VVMADSPFCVHSPSFGGMRSFQLLVAQICHCEVVHGQDSQQRSAWQVRGGKNVRGLWKSPRIIS
jgi:hypothetical protein